MTLSGFCTAFSGFRRIAAGNLPDVAARAKRAMQQDGAAQVQIFDDLTGLPVEVDFRGTSQDVIDRLPVPVPAGSDSILADSSERESQALRGPGRPRLGVIAREVTLLPRHWEWLNSQPGGASVALRKLVEQARRDHADKDRIRQSQEACYRFMLVMAGNLPGFEEAARALFAGQRARFGEEVMAWPADVHDHAMKLASCAFAAGD